MLKALIFDLDGTLCNTDAVHFPTWMEVLRSHGIDVDREFYEDSLSGRVNADVVDDILPDLSSEDRETLIKNEEDRSRSRTGEIGPLPGLWTLIEEGRKRDLRLTLVTNSKEEDAHQILDPLQLDGVFDPIVFPKEIEESKPAPDPYEEALKRLGISPDEALAFEDSVTGVESAVKAGVPVVGIARVYGPSELLDAGADLIIGDFADRALYERLSG